jgi:hypothetical protein
MEFVGWKPGRRSVKGLAHSIKARASLHLISLETPEGSNMPNGQVKNHSSHTLWVVETDTGHAIAHKLAPGRQSVGSVDADGFRAVDGTPIDDHKSWVKLIDLSTADVADKDGQLTRGCILCISVGDNQFGDVTYKDADGWGEPIS